MNIERLSTLCPLYLSAGEAHLCGVICWPLEVCRSTECRVMIWSGMPTSRQVLTTRELLSKQGVSTHIKPLSQLRLPAIQRKWFPSDAANVCGQIQMGRHIKMFKLSNVLFLCESLGDQAWMLVFDLQRHPCVGAVLNLTSQNWLLDECWVFCKWNGRRLYLDTFS